MSYSGRHLWDANDPYPDDDYPECDHVDYEADILTGEATCACGHRWMQTAEEIAFTRQMQANYDRQCEEWERQERSLSARFQRLVARVRAYWQRPKATDEIPF
jgi:hypothetical protein